MEHEFQAHLQEESLHRPGLSELLNASELRSFLTPERIRQLKAKYHDDVAHSRQVASLAQTLFELFQPAYHFTVEQFLLLTGAAHLHDLGQAVNQHHHDRHTAYVIENDEVLDGMSARLRLALALTAGAHRNRVGPGIDELAPVLARAVLEMAALLRLADALDFRHDGSAAIRFLKPEDDGGWVLGVNGLSTPSEKLVKKGKLFAEVFGARLKIVSAA
ncbi:MAG: HD domain-containing protein [Solirubrobacterales bacterium]